MASMAAMTAEREAQRAEFDKDLAEQKARSPLTPEDFDTTIDQVRKMVQKDVHPTWMHAAYADLAERMARLEAMFQNLEASMGLLHVKIETLIGHQALGEGQDTDNRQKGD
jgi:hypothetical protein